MKRRHVWLAVLGIVLVQAMQLVYVVHRESLTFDEDNHMFAGYMMWKAGDFGLNPEHPPLVKLLATAPILAEKLWIPPMRGVEFKQEAYLDGRDWLAHNDGSSQRLVFRMRLAAGLLSLALSWMVFTVARSFFGDVAGLVALLLVSFDPNILAHSALVTTDIGVSLFFLASVFAFYRYATRPTWARLAAAGITAGLLLATKHSGVLFAPMLLLLCGWEIASAPKVARARVAATMAGACAVIFLLGTAVLWSFYGFRYAARPAGLAFPTVSDYAQPLSHFNQAVVGFFARFHLLPESWLVGLVDVKRMAEFYPTFALGHNYAHGVWWYFPVVFLIKTTLGLLGLTAIAALAFAVKRHHKGRELAYLLIPSLFYLLVAILAGMDIGARHMLPVYVFLFIFAAGGITLLCRQSRPWRIAGGVLVAAHIASALLTFPNYIPYANEAWGGPKNVHNLLSDANVDWGQQLYQVKAWVDRHPGEECWFAYFAYPEVNPETYGIRCHHLPNIDTYWLGGSDIAPLTARGNVLISAGDLSGCEWSSSDDNPYDELRTVAPSESIDHAVFIYRGNVDLRRAAVASRVQVASRMLAEHRPAEAQPLLEEAVAFQPDSIENHILLGEAAASQGLRDEAREALKNALTGAGKLPPDAQTKYLPKIEELLRNIDPKKTR